MAEGFGPPLQFPQTTVECEKCGIDVDVTWFCKNCPASLCHSCKEDHSKDKLLKKHEIVPRSGSVLWSHGSWKLKEPCKIHKNSDLVTYCNDCKLPCCIDCMEKNHKSHDWSKLTTKYFEAESRLNSFVEDASKSSIQTVQNEISMLKQTIVSCNEDFNNVNSELNSAEIKLKNVVSKSFENLRQDLASKQKNCLSEMEKKIKSHENQLSDIENDIARTEQKIRTGGLDLIEYFPSHPVITSSHSDITTPIPRFILNKGVLKECKDSIGQICLETREGNRTDSLPSIPSGKETFDLTDIEVELISSFETSIYVRSIEPVSDNTAWVSLRFSEKMYLYSDAGKAVRYINVQGSGGIRDMAVLKNGGIIVTCCDEKVRCVSVDGKISTLIDTTPYWPLGVCLTDREEIVLCKSGQGEKNHVAVYTPDGMLKVREITVRDKDDKQLLTNPYLVVINDSQLTVLNFRDNVVSLDHHSGKLLWVYDGDQAKLNKTFNPHGMCRDKFSNLLVTDNNNHCIHYIDNTGRLIMYIMVKDYGLESPWGIGVESQRGRIWCGSSAYKKVTILKYLK